jgi:tetratricopeptide (TPR) repeat protein
VDNADGFAEAVAHAQGGRLNAALDALTRLVRDEPANAPAWAMRGSVELELGQLAAALESYDRAIGLRPGHAATHVNRGNALNRLGRFEAAVASYDSAIALDPKLAQAHSNRAQALNELRRHDEALESAKAALAVQPAYPNAWTHLGTAFYSLDRMAEALQAYERALQLAPDAYEALTNVGMALAGLGRHAEALARFDAAVAAAPDAPLAHYRRSFSRLILRDFAGGWSDYEHRWRTDVFTAKASGYVAPDLRPRLTLSPRPADLAGQRVVVFAEQGVGDEIMFASMLPDLAATAARVVLVCDPRLIGLFGASFPGVEVIGPDAALTLRGSEFDRVLALGSLAAAYRNDLKDFPAQAYLRPRDAVTEAWRRRLEDNAAALRVGISWRGGGRNASARARSMDLDVLRPVLTMSGCEFVNLQYGDVRGEIEAANSSLPSPIRFFDPAEIDDFEQLSGLVSALDLVVSVQTAVVHLSGALGRPCLAMIPPRPEWRYTLSGPSMPWYGSVQLFRQSVGEGWPSVVARVAAAVDALRRGSASA